MLIGGTTEPGGLRVHTADLASALARGGADVTILSLGPDFCNRAAGVNPTLTGDRRVTGLMLLSVVGTQDRRSGAAT